MRELLERLAGASFHCIVADPPWAFRSYAPPKNPESSRNVERHYRTMSLDQIRDLPVAAAAARDCHLFLWTTGPFLDQAIPLMTRWGFRYSAIAFVWVKMRRALDGRQLRFLPAGDGDFHVGLGFTTRKNVEVCLLGRRGAPRRKVRDVRELIVAPVREHSRKPDEAFARIERYATGPYLELFSRQDRKGWTCLGDEVGKFKFKMEVQDETRDHGLAAREGETIERPGAA